MQEAAGEAGCYAAWRCPVQGGDACLQTVQQDKELLACACDAVRWESTHTWVCTWYTAYGACDSH